MVSVGAEGAYYGNAVYGDLDVRNNFLLQIGGLPLQPDILWSFPSWAVGAAKSTGAGHTRELLEPKIIENFATSLGWSANDRKVYTAIGRECADSLKWRLSQISVEQRPEHELGRRGLAKRAEQAAAIRKAAPPTEQFRLFGCRAPTEQWQISEEE